MVSGGPYGIEDILGGAGYLGALAILIVLPFIWSLPTALMIGELASALPEEGGFYVWVRRAFGPFWGYQEAWLSLTASVFDMAIYPAISVLYLTKLVPTWTAGNRGVFWAVTVVVLCCLWNLGGARSVGRGAVSLFLLLLFPFAILVGAGYWAGWLRFLHHAPPMAHVTPEGSFTTAVLVAMWNYMGWDNASTVAQEVDNPRRNYPLAMLTTTAVVALSYIIPLSAIAAAGIPISQFSHRLLGRRRPHPRRPRARHRHCLRRYHQWLRHVQFLSIVLLTTARRAGRRRHDAGVTCPGAISAPVPGYLFCSAEQHGLSRSASALSGSSPLT